MEHMAELGGTVTGFHVAEQCIDCICGRDLVKVDRGSGEIIAQKTVFEKEGLSRKLIADDGQLIIYDFCTLYVFCQKDYELIGRWQLGDDLRSDICGMAADRDTVYCSIRNGKIITLNRQSHLVKEHSVCESSMWSVKTYGSYLVCGTVDGKLEVCVKNAHRKMFVCAGIWKDALVTVSFPCSEIAFWNKDTLEKIRKMDVPLQLSGRTHIEDGFMYISSRNIAGIDRIKLS